jgi:DNA-binding transcriptional LysR family regulator
MDRFRLMQTFVAVVDAGSLTRAADNLNLSRAAVSKQLRALETQLGARLVERTTRKFRLTESGQLFYERTIHILADIQTAEIAAGSMHREPRGELRVVAPPNFGIPDLGTIVSEFLQAHPRMTVTLSFNDRYVDLIESNFDIAIRIGRPKDSGLAARRINTSQRILCATADYLARRGTPKHPADLERHEALAYSYLDEPVPWQFSGPDGTYIVNVSARLTTSHGQALRSATLRGLGIAYGPAVFYQDDLAAGRLQIVLPSYVCPEVDIYSVSAARRHMSAKVRAFNAFMTKHFSARANAALRRP